MSALPFVVQPKRQPIIERIGSEESGIVEIPRRGYLTTGERAFVQQIQQFDNGTTEIVTVSRRVARAYGLGMDKAYNLVVQAISGAKIKDPKDQEVISKIELDFADDLTNVVKGLSSSAAREELVFAACLIKYRINPDYDITSINSLHPDIIEGLAVLYREEEQRSVEAFTKQEERPQPAVEELEKKPEKGISSRSKSSTGD